MCGQNAVMRDPYLSPCSQPNKYRVQTWNHVYSSFFGKVRSDTTTLDCTVVNKKFYHLVKHLFQSCTDALCCSFFCPKTCLNNWFSPVLALLSYHVPLLLPVSGVVIHLVFLPPAVQMMGMDHHCRCIKGWQQMEMGYK